MNKVKKIADGQIYNQYLTWQSLPKDLGKVVWVMYAVEEGYLYRRSIDQSDGSMSIARAEIEGDAHYEDWQPQNNMLPEHGDFDVTDEYRIDVRCEGGGNDSIYVRAQFVDDLKKYARRYLADWIANGDWGNDGLTVTGWYTVVDSAGDEVAEGRTVVEIEADRDAILAEAIDGGEIDDYCGDSDDDHTWTATVAVDGGCDQNPGVFAMGGTRMAFYRHCAVCWIKRREVHCGPQRNPGEQNSVAYAMPDDFF